MLLLLLFFWKSYAAPWRQLPCLIHTMSALHHSHDILPTPIIPVVYLGRGRRICRRRVVLYENVVLALIADASFRWRRRLTGTSRAVGCIVRRGDKGVRLPPTTAPFLSVVSSLYSHTHTGIMYIIVSSKCRRLVTCT